MRVGVTGTRYGMTKAQRDAFTSLAKMMMSDFHHGSCRGVDVEAANMVRCFHLCGTEIVCHPGPSDDANQEDSGVDDKVLPPKNHFARNRDIVNAVDLLIVVPREMEHQEMGGTWYTHDRAVKKGVPVKIIWPDGTVEDKL